MTKLFKLDEMDCAVCAAKAEKKVQKVSGVTNATIDFMSQRLCIEAENIDDALIKAVKEAVQKVEPDCGVLPL